MVLIHPTEARLMLHRVHILIVHLTSHVVKECSLFQLDRLMADKDQTLLARRCESCGWRLRLELREDKCQMGLRQL